MNSLTSLLGLDTDPQTGKVVSIKVCSWCEREKGETLFAQSFASQHHAPISHGICIRHYGEEMAKLRLD